MLTTKCRDQKEVLWILRLIEKGKCFPRYSLLLQFQETDITYSGTGVTGM